MIHSEDLRFRQKFQDMGDMVPMVGREEEEDEETESETSRGVANRNKRRKRRQGEEVEVGLKGYGSLVEAIGRFREIYERVEEAKQRQMVELEKQRMQFAKDLEIQRMKLFKESQLHLEKLKRSNLRSQADSKLEKPRKGKQTKNRTEVEEPPQPLKNWINLATEDQPKLAIPIGPVFQVDLPRYIGRSRDLDCLITEKFQCEKVGNGNKAQEIGEGRPKICKCTSPGSVKCIEYHVDEERMKLKTEIGPAYRKWKFHEMGDVVSETWTKQDHQTFDSLVKENRISHGEGFMKPALKSLPSKSRASIVSYYLNVYVPRRISRQTRSGCREIDTDDEEEVEEEGESNNRKTVYRAKDPVKMEIKSRRSSYLSGCR